MAAPFTIAKIWKQPKCPTEEGIKKVSLVAQVVKNLPGNTGDLGLISGSGRFLGEGNGNPLQYSCLENSMGKEDVVYINNEILLSHLKKSEIMPFAATRMGLEIITLSEVSQTKIWNLKNDTGKIKKCYRRLPWWSSG